jgi:tetratricopeptide (TPR) repeat protein
MFRKHLVAVCVLASAVVSAGLLAASPAHAQEVLDLDQPAKPKPKPAHHYHYKPRAHHAEPTKGEHEKPTPAPANNATKKVDVNLDKNAPEQQGPVVAGQPSEEFAQAKKLFDRERWMEAALALNRVVDKETPDDAGNRQLAQYYLAICLYRLKFYQASYSRFGAIADNKYHLKFKETLLWLAKLATQLPEPADIIERVGKYSDEEIARFNNPQQRDLYWQLNYLLGRYMYRNRRYPDAIAAFHKVDRESEYYVKSQFFTGISYVQVRKSVPAVESFERILKAINEGVKGAEDESRLRDLAYLSMARTYYSASIRLDPETNAPSVDARKLSAAVKYWNEIDVTSEYWLDALFEESWAYFMAGDYPRALGNIQTIESPYFPHAFYPEADIVKAVVFFSNCNYDAATVVVARFDKKYTPIRNKLQAVLNRFKGPNQEEPFFKFLTEVRNHTANLDPEIRGIVENALSDRQLLRNINYVHMLDAETSRFHKSPDSFRTSNLGQETEDALQQARQLAVKHTGELAIERYQRNLDDLNEHLRDGAKILIDITAAQRNLLDQAITKNQVSKAEAKVFGVVKPDSEHVRWPFDGEYWRDELGFYREVVQSACGR